VVIQILFGAPWDTLEGHERLSVYLSALEIAFPGFIGSLEVPGIARATPLATDVWRFWAAGVGADTDEPLVPPDALEFPGVPDLIRTDHAPQRLLEAVATLSMLTFSVVKTPTSQNERAFTMNRPRAAAATIGLQSAEGFVRPTTAMYHAIASTISTYPALRTRLCRELVRWVQSTDASPLMGVMISQVGLWRDFGLHGLKMVRNLVLAAGPVLAEVPGLVPYLEGFNEHWATYEQFPAATRDYDVAIYGRHSQISARRPYSPLVVIATELTRVAEGQMSMRNFAASRSVAFAPQLAAAASRLGVDLLDFVAIASRGV
jgi:hypothetical protein